MKGPSLGSDLIVALELSVLIEGLDFALDITDHLVEILLLSDHDIDEFVLLFVQVIALLLDLFEGVTWGAGETPLPIEVLVFGELELELLENAVDLHARGNLILELLDLLWGLAHLVLDARQVLNVLRRRLDRKIKSIESVHGLISHLLCLLGNQLNDLISDPSVLISNNVPDTAAVDFEHADNSEVLDLISKLGCLLSVLMDQFPELDRLWLGILVGQFSDHCFLVELVLVFVDLEGRDVLLKRLDALIDLGLEPLILLVDPGVFIWKLLLVLLVRCLGH